MPVSKPAIGVFWFVVHCWLFSVISTITKHLMLGGIPLFEILAFQNGGACLLMLPLAWKAREAIRRDSLIWGVARACTWFAATLLFFQATQTVPMPQAITLTFAVPLLTTILAVVFLKERLRWRRVVALVVGFIGVVIVLHPWTENFNPAAFGVLGASALWSVTDILIKGQKRVDSPALATFLFCGASFLMALPFAVMQGVMPEGNNLLWLLLLGGLAAANISTVFLSFRYAELSLLMPFMFTELLFVALLAWLVFDEALTTHTVIGGLVITASATYIAWREKRAHREAARAVQTSA
jgi:drug/metabolite transporter (DMT)-like permease